MIRLDVVARDERVAPGRDAVIHDGRDESGLHSASQKGIISKK
jgi:hypothetical protein